MGGHVAHIGETRNAYNILGGKPEGKRPFRRHTNRMNSSGTGLGPVAGSCDHRNEPSGSMKDGTFLD
jgi:hypothetical protein